jgi:alpha-beta hydrolase superfamily lysophospholipase
MSEVKRMICSDGKVLVYRVWIPENKNFHAILHIFHGMAEHSERYTRFALYLNTQGIAVYAQDHRGHGLTATDDELGWFAEHDGWNQVVEDGYQLSKLIAETHPGKDLFLLGHSMGSFLVETLIAKHTEIYQGAIISGTGANQGIMGKIGKLLASARSKAKGGKTPDALMDKMSFGKFGKPFQPQKTPFDWLSRDSEEVRKYVEDPLCGFVCSSQFFVDLLDGITLATDRNLMKKIPKSFPLLFISGKMDPVGGFGKGVEQVYGNYKAAGLEDVTLELIADARHELLNEINRDDIQVLLAKWLQSHKSRKSR